MSAPQENKHHQWCQGGLQLQGDLQDSADMHQKMVPIYLKKTLQIFRLTVGKQQCRYPKTSPWLLRHVLQTHPEKTVPLHLVVIFTTLQAQSPEDSAAHQTCLRNILHHYPQFLPPAACASQSAAEELQDCCCSHPTRKQCWGLPLFLAGGTLEPANPADQRV